MRNTEIELLRYGNISTWQPMHGDFVIYVGWWPWSNWYGIISDIDRINGVCKIIKEGIPVMLTRINKNILNKYKIEIDVATIQSSNSGAYSVLQNGVLYVDG